MSITASNIRKTFGTFTALGPVATGAVVALATAAVADLEHAVGGLEAHRAG